MNRYCLFALAIGSVLGFPPIHSHAQTDLVSAASAPATPAIPHVRPTGEPLHSQRGFPFKDKVRRSVSGVACSSASNSPLRCLVAFDEGEMVHFAQYGPGSFEPLDEPIALSDSGGELDAEGAATDGEFHYVVGSHSVKRESCASNPASRVLVRFKVAWPATAGAHRLKVESLQRTDRLWALMKADPTLGSHADACLGDGHGGRPAQQAGRPGLNIEGLAVKGGRLFLGFRAPSEAGVVPVYSVDAAALFDGVDAQPHLSWLNVGAGLGIRDMVAGRSAVLLLMGPDDRAPAADAGWRIAEWPDGELKATAAQPRVLATLDLRDLHFPQCFKELKPEAIAILDESDEAYRVLVLSDGVCDGGALVFDLKR